MFFHNGASELVSHTALCFVEFVRWWHQLGVMHCYVRLSSPDGGTGGEVAVCDCRFVPGCCQWLGSFLQCFRSL